MRYANIQQSMERAVAAKEVPSISVAVFRNGRIDWEKSVGFADLEKKTRATPRTSYPLASISKPFTATALMTLVAAGKIDLDAPINRYLRGEKIKAHVGDADAVTVRRVANHTSGLPFHAHFVFPDAVPAMLSMNDTIRQYGWTMTRPGERYSYSNLGYGILGQAIADSSGKTFKSYLNDAVIAPLGLRDTFLGPPEPSATGIAASYTGSLERLPGYVTDHPGASQVYSSAHDLIQFAAFHLKAVGPASRKILRDQVIDLMHANSAQPGLPSGYGLGFLIDRHGGVEVVSHGGFMPGTSTNMALIPSAGIGIVVLANSANKQVVEGLVAQIERELIPGWTERADTPPARPTPALAGSAAVGHWRGFMDRDEGPLPVYVAIAPDGKVGVKLGDDPQVIASSAAFDGSRLNAEIPASLHSADSAGYRYTVVLDVKLEGDTLRGEAIARDSYQNERFAAALTHWIDLRREP